MEFTAEALDEAVTITGGYPYFIQELGYAVWTVADGPVIKLDDIQAAVPAYEAKLDTSFFRVRLDRATDLQRAYLRAMAQLGPTAQKASDVADIIGRSSTNLGPTRAELINMGLLYARARVRVVYGSPFRPIYAACCPCACGAGTQESPPALDPSAAESNPRITSIYERLTHCHRAAYEAFDHEHSPDTTGPPLGDASPACADPPCL